MYSKYNVNKNYRNMYNYNPYNQVRYQNGDRFFGGGILAPLLVGGLAGYAIGNNNYNNNNCCPVPMYFVPVNNQVPYSYPMYY